MHTLYFVKLKKSQAKTSEEARELAESILDRNNFASDSNGFYGGSKADWYGIGGRYSGIFTDIKEVNEAITPLLEKELKESPELLNYLSINNHMLTPEKREAIDKIAKEKTGIEYFRSGYDRYEDDAQVITTELLARIKSEYSECEVAVVDEDEGIEDEYEVSTLDESSIGDWLVTIDHHN